MTKNFIKRSLVAFFVLTMLFVCTETISAGKIDPVVIDDGNTATSFTVTCYYQDGSDSYTTVTGKTTSSGSSFKTPAAPTRTGYNFEGWYATAGSGGTGYAANTTVNSKLGSLYAHWTEITYTVTVIDRDIYNNNELGRGTYTVQQGASKTATELRTATYANYDYKDCDQVTNILANTTLYRNFVRKFTVTYKGSYYKGEEWSDSFITFKSGVQYAASSSTESVQRNNTGTFPAVPLKYQTTHEETPNGGGPGYYIQYNIKRYITYDYNGGSGSVTSYEFNPLARKYFNFLGWYSDSSGNNRVGGADNSTPKISANTTYYALFENCNGVSYGIEPRAYTLPDATRDGYTLDGWYEIGTDEYIGKPGDKPTTYVSRNLYAKWIPDTTYYTITVKDVVGNSSGHLLGSGTYSIEEGLSANASTLRTTTYTGYTYKSASAAISSVSANATLYRYFSENEYTVTFNANGGSGSKASVTHKYSQSYTLPSGEEFTRKNHHMVGWRTGPEKGGNKITEIPAETDTDVTVYVDWAVNEYWVIFDGNGATSGSMDNQKLKVGNTKTPLTANAYKKEYTVTLNNNNGTDPDIEKAEYNFIGWASKSDGSGIRYDDEATVQRVTGFDEIEDGGSVTIYAVWNKPSDNVIPVDDPTKNSVTTSHETKIYDAISNTILETLSDDYVISYTFRGWNEKEDGSGTWRNSSYVPESNTTLYAIYDESYKTPSVTIPSSISTKSGLAENIYSNFYINGVKYFGATTFKTTSYTYTGLSTAKNSGITSIKVGDKINPRSYPTLYAQYNATTSWGSVLTPNPAKNNNLVVDYFLAEGEQDIEENRHYPGTSFSPRESKNYNAVYHYEYSVTFANKKGSNIQDITDIYEGTSITIPNYPKIQGDTCIGFYSNSDVTKPGIWYNPRSSLVVNEDKTIYCIWMSDLDINTPEVLEMIIYIRNIADISTLKENSIWMTKEEYFNYLKDVLAKAK